MATPRDKAAPTAYCVTAKDFFAPRSRELLGRLGRPFLDQLVIQRAAIAQVKDREQSVTARIKELHALLDDVEKAVSSASRIANRLTLAPDTYAATVRDVVKHTTPMKHDINCYHLASVYLRGGKTWEEKVGRLIALFSEDLSAEEIKYIDVLIAEVLRSKTARETLLGAYPRLLDRLYEIVDLHGGRYVAAPEGDAKPVVAKLNDALAKAAWPAVRATLISNIYGILSAWTPLASSEFMDELRAIGDVFRNLQRVKSVLGGARTIQLVEQRVGRTLSLENLGEQVRDVLEKSEQISILLEIGGHVVGKENRKLVANFIAYIIEDSELDQKLVAEREDDVGRLRLFASLHRAVRDSALGRTAFRRGSSAFRRPSSRKPTFSAGSTAREENRSKRRSGWSSCVPRAPSRRGAIVTSRARSPVITCCSLTFCRSTWPVQTMTSSARRASKR